METKPLSRQRRWQLKQMESGRCRICGDHLSNLAFCEKHRAAHAASQRKRYALAKAGV